MSALKIMAYVDAPPNDGLNLCGDADKFEQDDLWTRLLKSQVRASHARVMVINERDALPNDRIELGCMFAGQFYKFLRTFCTAKSARQVCDYIMRRAMADTERESKARDKESEL